MGDKRDINTGGGNYFEGNVEADTIIGTQIIITVPASEIINALPAPGIQPYKGLESFSEQDERIFVGREMLTNTLLKTIEKQSLTVVIGASGSGKSSLMRAGIVPKLKEGNWQCYLMTPDNLGIQQFVHLLDVTQNNLQNAQIEPARVDEIPSHAPAEQEIASNTSKNILIIDQFEQLFTKALVSEHTAREQLAFVDNLINIATSFPTLKIVIVLRSDFFHHCNEYPKLYSWIGSNLFPIASVDRDNLQKMIVLPAYRTGWKLQAGLVDLILHDVGNTHVILPFLSHALLETWKNRRGNILTIDGYKTSGGVRGAIAKTAEALWSRLQYQPIQQEIVTHIFVSLVQLGDENDSDIRMPHTRRRIERSTLSVNKFSDTAIDSILRLLSDSHLIKHDTISNQIEIAHEILLIAWERLPNWIKEQRKALRIHRQLEVDVKLWNERERNSDYLYGEHQLQLIDANLLNPDQQEFLAVSQKKLQNDRRRQLHRRATQVGASIAIMFLIVALWFVIDRARSPWQTVYSQSPVTILSRNINTNTLYSGTYSTGVLQNRNDVEMGWQPYGVGFPQDVANPAQGATVSALASDPSDSNRVAVAVSFSAGGVYINNDKDAHWENQNDGLPIDKTIVDLELWDDLAVGVTTDYKMYLSKGENIKWDAANNTICPNTTFETLNIVYDTHILNPAKIIAGTEIGIVIGEYENDCWSWQQFNETNNIGSVTLIESANNHNHLLFFASREPETKKYNNIYLWDTMQAFTNAQHINRIDGTPLHLAPFTTISNQNAIFVLLDTHEVVAITSDTVEDVATAPDLPFDLLATSSKDGEFQLLLSNDKGIQKFRDDLPIP